MEKIPDRYDECAHCKHFRYKHDALPKFYDRTKEKDITDRLKFFTHCASCQLVNSMNPSVQPEICEQFVEEMKY